jgi:lipopolysaccharide transport system ATP-binding protein
MMRFFAAGEQLIGWKKGVSPNILDCKYEDLLVDTPGTLRNWFEFLGLNASNDLIMDIVDKTSFSRLTKGRKPGEEDVTNHFRKGVAGDWKQYFTAEVKKEFNLHYGEILIEWGYEHDGDW